MNWRVVLVVVGVTAVTASLGVMVSQTWLRAHLGGVNSQLQLAYGYAIGNGVEQDDFEATRWYRRAAEQGDARGAFSLASRYDEGRGIEKDHAEATDWYTKAAEYGSLESAFVLATRFHEGIGVPKDNVRAAMWLIVAQEFARNRSDGQQLLEALKASLGETDLVEARRLAGQWRAIHAPAPAQTTEAAQAAPEPVAATDQAAN